MPENIVEIFSGSDAQPLQDQIKVGGRPFPLGPAATVKFRMREAKTDVLKVDEDGVVVTESTGEVSYDWTDTDIDTPGEYFGWWHVILIDGEIDTAEFPIVVREHAPGYRTRNGAIYRAARSILPITWDALEQSSKYGDSLLQERIEVVKLTVFDAEVAVDDEASYDPRVIEFIGKLVALQVIPAGIDYWLAQHETFVAQGTQETASYPDRVRALQALYETLQKQVAAEQSAIDDILDVAIRTRPLTDIPGVSPGAEDGFLTPLPVTNFPEYSFPKINPWEEWF